MKEFFILFLVFFLSSCGSSQESKGPDRKIEEFTFSIEVQRAVKVNDTFASADYPINTLQNALDSLSVKGDISTVTKEAEALILLVQALENRTDPLLFTDTGMRSRLKLLRTYLLQFKGALEEQTGVESAFESVNQANNALLTYWNNLVY